MKMTDKQRKLNTMSIAHLSTAPTSQLSERLRKMCEDFDGTDEAMVNILQSIYFGCCESDNFAKLLVNPHHAGWTPNNNSGPKLHCCKVK